MAKKNVSVSEENRTPVHSLQQVSLLTQLAYGSPFLRSDNSQIYEGKEDTKKHNT
jgi:hypothetical protein